MRTSSGPARLLGPFLSIILGAVTAIAVVVGVAAAGATPSTPNQINACVNNKSGVVTVPTSNNTCSIFLNMP